MTVTSDQALSVRLPRDLYEQVKDRAAAEDRSINALIRVALRDYLNHNGG